ncbi:MAG: methylmalonyl Co-A mutase-associated GTPase MeaB [Bacteroidia bacterium]|nr:methylmalonyl Co-A mutase-associated GTPase MeaB [Bacteroidia bacterium]MCF8427425.1 methylmalonyl Co-A mutase-associated GTPase MeaB [Bacteroidia bacterium]MCF8447092.1 methylmalonyl Co-A mutase-associated GTPase MeaB [Bacteroidia bacterium]
MQDYTSQIVSGDRRSLARFISLVENDVLGYEEQLAELPIANTPLIGITGPPGAGKSTLINALAAHWLAQGKKVAIVAVDPSSPFNQGALMGDRLRMSEHFLNPNLFIRSMASRGSLGGLAPKIFEVCDVLRAAQFDYVIIETVGVGQSEVEIAALADTTVLVLVPEAGDDIQTIKSGVMEIADIFVLNKSDRDGAATFQKNLLMLAHQYASSNWEAPVVKTVASQKIGLEELGEAIENHHQLAIKGNKKVHLLAQKALLLIKAMRTKDIQLPQLEEELAMASNKEGFNLYRFIRKYQS